MYHSITFGEGSGEKNTWDDWKLIPSPPPIFAPPKINTKFIQVPGTHGSLDLTEVFGSITYAERTGSWKFYMTDQDTNWLEQYSTILGFLHGKQMKAVLEDDQAHYYIGRFSVAGRESGKNFSSITINYQVGPFRYTINGDQGSL